MNLSDAIDAFAANRQATGVAAGTRRNELAILRRLLADVGNVQVHNLKPQHIDTFWARRTTWGAGTKNRARSTLMIFFDWCRNRNYMPKDVDPVAGSRRIKVPPRDRIIIPQSEFTTILAERRNPRERIITALGLYLFLRLSETANLRWQDFNFDTNTVEVYRQKTLTIDTLPLCVELVEELRAWRRYYAVKVGEQVQGGWFVVPGLTPARRRGIPGQKGFAVADEVDYVPTRKGALGDTIARILTEAGYYKPMEGGHTLRRSGAVALYNQLTDVGHDRAIRVCQAMLGHSSIQTTEVYLRLDLDRKVRNDLLAGKPMFPEAIGGEVVPLERFMDGQANTGSL
jgi:integrase